MDFVVAGFGIGAIIVIVGFALRDVALLLRRTGSGHEVGSPIFRAVGDATMMAGLLICLATLVSLVLGVNDSLGNRVVGITTMIAVVAILGRAATLVRGRRSGLSLGGRAGVWQPPIDQAMPVPQAHLTWPTPRCPDGAEAADAAPRVGVPVAAPSEGDVPAIEPHAPPLSAAPFQSPVLAGVEADVLTGGDGAFRSPLLADVKPDASPRDPGAFQSSLLTGWDHVEVTSLAPGLSSTAEPAPGATAESADAEVEGETPARSPAASQLGEAGDVQRLEEGDSPVVDAGESEPPNENAAAMRPPVPATVGSPPGSGGRSE